MTEEQIDQLLNAGLSPAAATLIAPLVAAGPSEEDGGQGAVHVGDGQPTDEDTGYPAGSTWANTDDEDFWVNFGTEAEPRWRRPPAVDVQAGDVEIDGSVLGEDRVEGALFALEEAIDDLEVGSGARVVQSKPAQIREPNTGSAITLDTAPTPGNKLVMLFVQRDGADDYPTTTGFSNAVRASNSSRTRASLQYRDVLADDPAEWNVDAGNCDGYAILVELAGLPAGGPTLPVGEHGNGVALARIAATAPGLTIGIFASEQTPNAPNAAWTLLGQSLVFEDVDPCGTGIARVVTAGAYQARLPGSVDNWGFAGAFWAVADATLLIPEDIAAAPDTFDGAIFTIGADPVSVAANVPATLVLDDLAVLELDTGYFDAGQPTRLTAPRDGVYDIHVGVSFAGVTGVSYTAVAVIKNGSDALLSTAGPRADDVGNNQSVPLGGLCSLEAGDFIEVSANQNNEGPSAINVRLQHLSIRFVGGLP